MNALSIKLSALTNLSAAVKTALENKGYQFAAAEQHYNLNIIAVRSNRPNPDKFNDSLLLIYNDALGPRLKIYDITTYPASFYLRNPLPKTGGAGVLVAGQYPKAFGLGTHSDTLPTGGVDVYTCLTQLTALPVYRDKVQDGKLHFEAKTLQTGMFGIEIHRAAPKTATTSVARWSSGSQVFADAKHFDDFMAVIQKAHAAHGDGFTYTIIGQDDLLPKEEVITHHFSD